MATHSGILAWKIPWAEAPGGLQLMNLVTETMMMQTTEQTTGSSLPLVIQLIKVLTLLFLGFSPESVSSVNADV